ncbi:unnamed protein product [Staurois parvus]|uniref:Uncharacterized protein n=1 Tax=Staurois parvus TaxID=386267 RepID=A0ABN9EP91_9NEOB|nr:unnamed protein product [Staurois parvus]
MSCQSTPGCTQVDQSIWVHSACPYMVLISAGSVGGPMRCPWYLFHRLF